jgi:uncharacterized linocin/CFP29 family protein
MSRGNGVAVNGGREFLASGGRWATERLMAALKNGGALSPDALRTADVLQKDEWIHFDDAIVEEGIIRLRGVADLVNAGLTIPVPNAMGKTIFQWEKVTDMNPAEVSLSGVNRTENDRIDYDLGNLPLPITHKDFDIQLRTLEASRTRGEALDTTQARIAGRLVAEEIERMLFRGGKTFGGSTIYGYTNHPDRNTVSIGTAWDDVGQTGDNILTDVLAMIAAAEADRYNGPYNLYIPSNYSLKLELDFKANGDKSIRQRISEVDRISSIRTVDQLPEDNVVLVQMTRDVVALVDGEPIQTVQWDAEGGFLVKFKVMAIQVPLIRSDATGRSGVVHLS